MYLIKIQDSLSINCDPQMASNERWFQVTVRHIMTTLKGGGCGTFGTELLKVYSWRVAIHDFFLTLPSLVCVYKPQR
jgi:hypothetical protein